MSDPVNHPAHYETGNFECFDVMLEVFGVEKVKAFCQCNAFKYLYRMDRKNGTEDAEKAVWYLNKLDALSKLENKKAEATEPDLPTLDDAWRDYVLERSIKDSK